MNEQLIALADDLERDQETLQRELDEIEMLLKQTATEAERQRVAPRPGRGAPGAARA